MWTCGRTAYQDKHVVDAMGCHSPIQSKFPEMMRFKDQKTIYNKVIAWQTPVKEGYAKVIADMASIQDLLKVTKLSTADRAQVQLYAEEARLNAAKIKDDAPGVSTLRSLPSSSLTKPRRTPRSSRHPECREQDRQEVILPE